MAKQFIIKSPFKVYCYAFIAALVSFTSGYAHAALSQIQNLLQSKNNYTTQEVAFTLTIVISSTNFGQIIGPLLYNHVTNKYGQVKTIITCNKIIIICLLLQLIQLRFAYLFIGRLLMGFVIGIQASVIPLYLNSMAPVSISGKVCSLNQFLTSCGVIFSYVIGYFLVDDVSDQFWWRLLVGFPILSCLFSTYGLSNYYNFDRIQRYIQKRNYKKVEQYAKLIYSDVSVEDIIFEKTPTRPGENQVSNKQYKRECYRYKIAMVVICALQLSGISAIFIYAKQLFLSVTDHNNRISQDLMMGIAFCQAISCSISGKFIDMFGRKYLLEKGLIILTVILGLIFLVDNLDVYIRPSIVHYVIISLIYLHVIAFNFTLGPICILYSAELVDNMTPIIMSLRASTFMVALTTNYIIHEYGIGQLFLIYSILTGICYYYLTDHLRETKNRSKPVIYDMFESDLISDDQENSNLLYI